MKFNKVFHIEKAASTDENRYVLNGVYLDKEEKKLIATDGRRLAMVPCEPDAEDESQIIPSSALQAHRRSRGKKDKVLELTCNGSIRYETKEGKAEADKVEGNFPAYKQVLPKWDEGVLSHEFSFNPKFLYELAQALGSPEGVTLKIAIAYYDERATDVNQLPRDHAIEVTPTPLDSEDKAATKGAKGLLMPVRST